MKTAEFLFPYELEVTSTSINKALFIGSCLAEVYVKRIKECNPSVLYDFILFNNASELPSRSVDEIGEYDYQYIQLSLRSVLTDSVIRILEYETTATREAWLSTGKRNIDLMLENALTYNAKAGLLSFVATFIVPQGRIAPSLLDARSPTDLTWIVNELNNYLANTIWRFRHVFIADVDMIADAMGKRYFLDDFIVFNTHGSVFYPDWHHFESDRFDPIPDIGETYENRIDEFFSAVFRQIESLYRTVKQIDMVKVVIFDLDNTLWRGLLVEQYQPGEQWPHSHGWPLGVWEAVQQLRWRGIATAIVSKNDRHLVEEKWHDAVDPPFVKFADFLIVRINWESKAENVKRILDELSLTAKSAVFVDDHPVERAAVNAALPGIRVIGSNPFTIKRVLLWSAETQLSSRSAESANREQSLKKQFEREKTREVMSREAFLNSLDSKVEIWEIKNTVHPSFTRVSELVNKTNQFNTNGRRWGMNDYRKHFEDGGRIFVFSVKDRFTEYGTVGVIFTNRLVILQYVMSCRVLGMDVEIAALTYAIELIRRGDRNAAIYATIVHTDTNTPARDVYVRSGFFEISDRPNSYQLPSMHTGVTPRHVTMHPR